MKRKITLGRRKQRQPPVNTLLLSTLGSGYTYSGSAIDQTPDIPGQRPMHLKPNMPVYSGTFTIQYSVDRVYASDTSSNFSFSASNKLGRNMVNFDHIRIRMIGYNIIRNIAYVGADLPMYLYTNLGKTDDEQFLAYLTANRSDVALGGNAILKQNAANNIYQIQLFFNRDKTLGPTIADMIDDTIFHFEFQVYCR